eukprot:15451962-Alexandrium_andersonii.AAC.1
MDASFRGHADRLCRLLELNDQSHFFECWSRLFEESMLDGAGVPEGSRGKHRGRGNPAVRTALPSWVEAVATHCAEVQSQGGFDRLPLRGSLLVLSRSVLQLAALALSLIHI